MVQCEQKYFQPVPENSFGGFRVADKIRIASYVNNLMRLLEMFVCWLLSFPSVCLSILEMCAAAAAAADRMSASRRRRFRDVFSHVVHQLYVARFL